MWTAATKCGLRGTDDTDERLGSRQCRAGGRTAGRCRANEYVGEQWHLSGSVPEACDGAPCRVQARDSAAYKGEMLSGVVTRKVACPDLGAWRGDNGWPELRNALEHGEATLGSVERRQPARHDAGRTASPA
jgi:hypothetical protein